MDFYDRITEGGEASVRPRLARLETEEDFLQDQQRFFLNTSQTSSSPDPFSTHLVDDNKETPTSAILPPIQGKKVKPRRRRRVKNNNNGIVPSFPSIPNISSDANLSSLPTFQKQQQVSTKRVTFQENEHQNLNSTVAEEKLSKSVERGLKFDGSISNNSNNKTITNNTTNDISVVQEKRAPSEDAQNMLSEMSAEDIHASQVELMEKLDPEMLEFLQQKWRQRGLGQYSNSIQHSSSSSNVDIVKEDMNIKTSEEDTSKDDKVHSVSSSKYETSTQPATARSMISSLPQSSIAEASTNANDNEPSPPPFNSINMKVDFKKHESDIRDSLLIPKRSLDEKEAEKMLWATDASVEIPSETKLDHILKASLDILGDFASKRFDLSGHILSDKQIATLPTHLGLHHHGSSPASAGYTLSDILTLLRSSVATQRTMALQMLAQLVRQYGHGVATPLAKSGALALAFAPFPSPRVFYSAVTCQLAYVNAVKAFVNLCYLRQFSFDDDNMKEIELVPELFFASSFYAPAHPQSRPFDILLDTLSTTDCVSTLTRVAFSNATDIDEEELGLTLAQQPLSLSALHVMRRLVTYSDDACYALSMHKPSVNMLRTLAVSSSDANIVMLCCDVIAQTFVRVAWGRQGRVHHQNVAKLARPLLDSHLVHQICTHLSIVLGDAPSSLADLTRASGAMRVARAALAFRIGVMPVSSVAQAVCKLLITDNPSIAAEAYLILEGYVHCLHEFVAKKVQDCSDEIREQQQDRNYDHSAAMTRGHRDFSLEKEKDEEETTPSSRFIQDQLSNLVPAALRAIHVFADHKTSLLKRSAAGHFAATLLSVYRVPLGHNLFALILSTASSASSTMLSRASRKIDGDENSQVNFSCAASICHAAARLLTRLKLERGYVKREVLALLDAARREGDDTGVQWRPVANACAEWLGLYARTEPGRNPAWYAVELLPLLSDVQVMVDLISRCIINVDCLCALEGVGKLSIESAHECAKKLIPVAYDGLCRRFASKEETEEDEKDEDKSTMQQSRTYVEQFEERQPVVASLFTLMDNWLKERECWASGVHVMSALVADGVVESLRCFNYLLGTSAELLNDEQKPLFKLVCKLLFMSGSKAAKESGKLVIYKRDTVLSTTSTSPNPQLADGILKLVERLVACGPSMQKHIESKESGIGGKDNGNHSNYTDLLSSVLLTLMCSQEVDVSLRLSMWEISIEACGGALLFSNAEFLSKGGINRGKIGSNDIDENNEDELMLSAYVRAIGKGFLGENRCPNTLGEVVMIRIEKAMREDADRECIQFLRRLMQGEAGSGTRAQQTFSWLTKFANNIDLVNDKLL